MNKIDRIYYINLDRRPDRNTHFLNQCRQHDLPFSKIQRFQAIDGLTYNFTEDKYKMFANCDYFRTLDFYRKNNMQEKYYKIAEELTRKIMGNQLSHYTILNDIVNNDYEYAIVFQDDAKLNNNFVEYIDNLIENLPEDTEVMNIGANRLADGSHVIPWDFEKDKEETIIIENINDYVGRLHEDMNPCSLAYIVTKKGARNLVAHFNTVGFLKATDFNFNHYLMSKNIFYSCRKIMATTEYQGSDVFELCNVPL
jgi:GR25 family glycosyltransferase involved in LPS biosynthesis